MTNNNLILYDVGAVLLELDYGSFYREASRITGRTAEDLRKVHSQLELESLTGRMPKHQFLARMRLELTSAIGSDDELIRLLLLSWPRPIHDMVALKRKTAQANADIGLFSNIGDISLELLTTKFPEVFDLHGSLGPRVYSFQVGAVKPNMLMYEAINSYKKVVLVEDKPNYLRIGIEEFGWSGVYYFSHIDPAESIRAVQGKQEFMHPRMLHAKSAKEVEAALLTLGFL
ncbi:TPA: hypothetical protein HA242_00355 [Candidatus Woesearchaeota archaeon]|nr:hypothetical protein [Candidatus Woesearchaeota archaeon]HIG93940.1 hypothetical protein [Candidatus Woesearchaeota archaeon]HIH12155.1 hypothetical protein [Candidatus Woesearchaeota archaeon]